jgi:hypothetical protein
MSEKMGSLFGAAKPEESPPVAVAVAAAASPVDGDGPAALLDIVPLFGAPPPSAAAKADSMQPYVMQWPGGKPPDHQTAGDSGDAVHAEGAEAAAAPPVVEQKSETSFGAVDDGWSF